MSDKSETPPIGPVITKRRFAEISGLTEEIVRGMVDRGYLPSLKIGKHRMINMTLMTRASCDRYYM